MDDVKEILLILELRLQSKSIQWWHWPTSYTLLLYWNGTLACFLALHEITFGPRNTEKPLVKRLSSRRHGQSASEKVVRRIEEDL
jgi:hypothetical protein